MRTILMVVLGALLIASSASIAAGESPAPLLVTRWDFTEPGDLQGWSAGPNVADLAVSDGVLRFRTLTNDPYIFAPPIEAPLDGCVVRVAVRCARASDTQVYWVTPDYPQFGEHQVMTLYSPGGTSEFTVLEFAIGKPSDAGRTLTGFRLDPCGGPVQEIGEIDFVEVLRVPPLLEARLSFDHHAVLPREPARLSMNLRQIAGWRDHAEYEVLLDDGQPTRVAASTQPARSTHTEVRFDRVGVHRVGAVLREAGSAARYDLQTSIVVGAEGDLPVSQGLRTPQLALDFIRAVSSDDVAAARLSVRDREGKSRLAGWLLPLARITVLDEAGSTVQREPALAVHLASDEWTRLEGIFPDLPGWRVQVDFRVQVVQGVETIEVTASLAGPEGGQLLDFSAPALRVEADAVRGPLHRFAVFGGLEMLEPGWVSSSDRAVGEKFAERHTPHPFKIALPLMSVETHGLTTSMMWQPLDKWDGEHALPAATFSSPNRLEGQANHLMRLWAPSVPDWVNENQSYAGRAYVMYKARPLTLRYLLHAEAGLPAAMAARRWFELFGCPQPAPQPHDDRELYDLIARNYGHTMYWPEQGGWTQHWFFDQRPGAQPEMAAFLAAHAADTGNREWVERTGLADRAIINTAGTLVSRLTQGDRHARAVAASMQADGTWPFHNTEGVRKLARELTNGQYDSLGDDGATELGVCAGSALVILKQARLAGTPELIEAGLRALEGMRRFRVPRGAQVWEVHLEIPDIRAAALAVEAFQIGYQLTGDARYLDEASYWAWTGVPFIYSWHVPIERRTGTFVGARDRHAGTRESIPIGEAYHRGCPQVTPYGTLPVLGPTFYVINWFGVLVQWCGLEWAQKVIELDADRPDPLLRTIADGVVLSGWQQMMDKEPWVGLYPDSWLLDHNICQPAMIYPGLILACAQAQGRLPAWSCSWSRILRDEHSVLRWHLCGWGKPVHLDPPNDHRWSARIEFLPGQPSELVLTGAKAPAEVLVGRAVLPRQSEPGQTGWTYEPASNRLVVRFLHDERVAQLGVTWPDP